MGLRIGLIILCLLSTTVHAVVKDPAYDEYEGVELAEVLIRDGRFEDAAKTLHEIPSDSPRLFLARGRLHHAKGNFRDALLAFKQAPATAERSLLIALAEAGLENWAACARGFQGSSDLWLNEPKLGLIKAKCEWKINQPAHADTTMKTAYDRHLSFSLKRERVLLYLETARPRAALELAFAAPDVPAPGEVMAMAELFHNKNHLDEALAVLEWGRLSHPFDLDLNLSLAKVYHLKSFTSAMTEAFDRAARSGPRYAYHVAEIARQQGQFERAAFFAHWVENDRERMRTNVARAVDRDSYALIASMAAPSVVNDALADDEVRYALAYALSRVGDVKAPLKLLDAITSPALQDKAGKLKKTLIQ